MHPVSRRMRLRRALAAAAVVVAPVLLPAAAAAQEPAGRTVVGELVQAMSDQQPEDDHAADAHGHEVAEPLTWVETADGDTVRLPSEDAADLPVGATVEVIVGDQVSDAATDDDGLTPAVELLDSTVVIAPATPVVPPRAVTNEVTVALVAPGRAPADGVDLQQLVGVVDGAVARFWDEQSGGAISLGVTDSHGWTTTVAGCEDPGRMWTETAAKVGFRSGPGKHLLVYVSSAAQGCSYGLAQVGAAPSSGGRAYVTDVLPSLIAHEIGHNFGLGHSSSLYCARVAEGGGCDTAAYRDHYDVMGASWEQMGSLNVVQADRLGVLPAEAVRTVHAPAAPVRVALAPLTAGGIRAVRLVGATGGEYWLELRTATGQDAWLDGPDNRFHLESGVLVRRSGPWPHTSLLLDPTPPAGRGGDFQTALPVGETVALGGGAFEVTVSGGTAAGAMIDVRTGQVGVAEAEPVPPEAGDRPTAGTPETLPAAGCLDCSTTEAPAPVAREADDPEETAAVVPVEAVAAPVPAVDPQPAVAAASSTRSLAVPAAGAAFGCSALLLVRRLVHRRTTPGRRSEGHRIV